MEKKFLNKGYITSKVEDAKALKYISQFIKKKLAKYLKCNSKKILFNTLHKKIPKNRLNEIRVRLIKSINKDKKLRECYFNLAKKNIFNIVGNELAMQKNINLSIQLPGDEDSLLPLHSDTWSGDSPFETVLWVPLVNCYKTKSMFILESTHYNKFRKIYKKIKNSSSQKLYSKIKKDLNYLRVNYGNFLLFNQNLPHGNSINITKETRVSLNCRFKGLFTPYQQKKIGEFFSPLIIKPASKIGLKYKYPDE
jgi:sporadic carbohydrate cluster 2OG-Fe(II) oxygenase